jgi:hypothetical protein
MMPGIEVLNIIEITKTPIYMWILLIVVGFLTMAFVANCDATEIKNFIISMIGLVAIIGIWLAGMIIAEPVGYKYEVLIDEEVNLVEFYEKYEILEVEGKIYTIKERDKD